jgi:acyl-CoA synthetase (AMP-forming)/AMP-acid ligase II
VTPADLLQQQLRRDGARPLLTWYDDGTGERIELSVTTAANWAVKTANLLLDEHGLDAGDVITLRPTSHWLSVVALLGAWTAGVGVALTGDLAADARGDALPGDPAAFMRAVLPQPDALLVASAAATGVALVTAERSWTASDVVDAAGHPPAGCRVLTTLPLDTVAGVLAAVVVPLVAGGSSVLVTNAAAPALAARAETERATHTAGVELDGYPPLPIAR